MENLPEPLPYVEITSDALARRAAEVYEGERVGPDLVFSGSCPRCEHPAIVVIPDLLAWRSPDASAADRPPYEVLVCSCEETHPGRPTFRAGCGAYWHSGVRV